MILKESLLRRNQFYFLLGTFWEHLGYFSFQHLVTLARLKYLPGVFTLAVELFGRLLADAAVLAGIGVTAVDNQAGLQRNVVLGGVLLVFPVARQLVVAINCYVTHAAEIISLI